LRHPPTYSRRSRNTGRRYTSWAARR